MKLEEFNNETFQYEFCINNWQNDYENDDWSRGFMELQVILSNFGRPLNYPAEYEPEAPEIANK